MLELNADNAADYLQTRHGITATRVVMLAGGVSNLVLRVETAAGLFILKQSRPQLRTRDAWFSDVARVYREQEVMQALADVLPAETVPRILFADRPNFLFAMSHAPPSRNWKELLLAGDIDTALGQQAGRTLGRMHDLARREPQRFAGFTDRTVYVQLRVDPFYRRVQERRPEVAAALAPLIDHMLTSTEGLCHGDYTPKNMLVHAGGFTLVDYETAHVGDPMMDLGLFLTHLLLKAVRQPKWRSGYFELIDRFWAGYRSETELDTERERRAAAHWAACLLARIDGTSPVDYLPEEPKRECVRQLARSILHQGLSPRQIMVEAERGCAALAGTE